MIAPSTFFRLSNYVPAKAVLFFILFSGSQPLAAQLKISAVFSDNMVLQRDKMLPVWGEATPGETISVAFANQKKKSVADSRGHWELTLDPLAVSAIPQEFIITAKSSIVFHNVLVGDVWLCTGQSNMEYPMDRALKHYALPARGNDLAKEELERTDKPTAIRYLYVEKDLKKYPALPSKGWISGADTTLRFVSAVGYFFAKEVYASIRVPIGIISSSWGGTRIEQWTPAAAYENTAVFKNYSTSDSFRIDGIKPGQMYKGLIEPLIPFAIKGILWYQGESNCMIEDQDTYREKMRIYEDSWRALFRDPGIPFYTVQISPYLYSERNDAKKHRNDLLPEFWEAQSASTSLARTYMIVTTDLVDNLKDIHPSYKWIVGHRLALQALQGEYGYQRLVANGPAFKSMRRKGKKLILSFTNTGSGLLSNDGKSLNWFTIAGKDGVFKEANATVVGNKVMLKSAVILKPTYVRFAWEETARPNFCNKEGLPCIPFRTDHF